MKLIRSSFPRHVTVITVLLAAFALHAQRTLYWTGGSGEWSDAAHWSTAPGGAGGAGVPHADDDVMIDAGGAELVISTDAACHELRITGGVTISGSARHDLRITGGWTMVGNMRWTFGGTVRMTLERGNAAIDTRGIALSGDVVFDGGGEWDLLSALHVDDAHAVVLKQGTLRTNDRALKLGALRAEGHGTKRFEAGGSIILAGAFEPGGFRSIVDPGSSTLMVGGLPRHWDGSAIDQEEFARAMVNCGTGPGQTMFTVTASVTTNYNGFGVSCNGACDGAVVVNITGGIGPFSIQWSGGPTTANWGPICAGNKLVIVTDLGQGVGCFASVLITPPPPLGVLFFGLNPPTCADVCNGTAITFPGGGTGFGYVYDWNGGVESGQNPAQLCAGLNTLHLIDANLCQYDTSFTIPLLPLAPVLVTANASCFGDCNGTADVTVSGGVPDYTYNWEPGTPAGEGTPNVTGLCAGNYTLIIADANGCDTTLAFVIDQPAPISPNASHTDASCSGICDGTAGVAPSGAVGPYDFDWSPDPISGDGTPNVTGLCPGDYTVLITDQASGCDTLITITILAPPALDVQLVTTDVTCSGDCDGTAGLTISGGTPGYVITWSPGLITGQGTPNASQLCAGDYSVNVTDAAGCDTTIDFTINAPAPILPNESHTDITCAGACDGTATVAPTGGTGVLSVVWSPNPPVGQNTSTASQLCAGDWSATITDDNGCDTTVTITILEPPPLQATPSHTDVTCGGLCDGTASVDVTGGTGLYTYDWTPAPPVGQGTDSVSALCAGNWSVLITDANGCTLTVPFTILDAVPFQFSLQVNDATCPDVCDASAGVIVTGGAGSYVYDWEPGTPAGDGTANVTGLCPGPYTLTVTDALGCDSTIAFTIGAPPAIVPNATVEVTTCNGDCDGSVVLAPTGGTGVYTYAWVPVPPNGDGTNSATGLCAGDWTVTITSGACDTTITYTITGPPPFVVQLSTTDVLCSDDCNGTGTIDDLSGGTPGYTINWSPAPGSGQGTPNATEFCPGSYTLTITDAAGCDTTIAFTINAPPPIDPQLVTTDAGCGGACDGTASVAPGYTYDWSPDPINGDGTPNATGLCPGIYTVLLTDPNGCDTLVQFTINTPSGILATGVVTDATCADVCDGVIEVTLLDFSDPPYTLDWTPDPPFGEGTGSVSGLCPGQWVLQITNGLGCDTLMLFDVGSPPPILPNGTFTNETCNGPCDGTASFAPSGGTPGYTFFWTPVPPGGQGTPSATGLCAGSYTVLIGDAAGCDTLVTFDILPAQPIDAGLTTTDVSCSGACDGTATVSPSGGSGTYDITWTPPPPLGQNTTTASALCAGNWSVTVSDVNGCDTTIAFVINEPSAITVSLTTINEDCSGPCSGSAIANAGGGAGGFQYDWSPDPIAGDGTPNVTGLCAGVAYSVMVTDISECDTTVDFTIGSFTAIVPNISSVPANCNGACDGSATVGPTGGVPPYSYDWLPDPPGGDLNPQATGLCAGVWQVTITDSIGCDTTVSVLITEPEPIIDNATVGGVSCNGSCDGSITVVPSGGTPGYSYAWNPIPINGDGNPFAFGLCPGPVSLTITDSNGCDSTFTYIIDEPPPLVVGADVTPSQCQLCIGTIAMHVSGGQAPYSFFVIGPDTVFFTTDSLFTTLCAGLYSVQVNDGNSCTVDLAIPITDSDAEQLTMQDGSVQCPADCNGSVSVSFTCSDPPCTTAWFNSLGIDLGVSSDTLSGLCPGDYYVQVTNGSGCIAIDTASVIAPNIIVANISTTPETCPGSCDGTATSGPTGGIPPYTYDWSPDPPGGDGTPQATGLCAGTYDLTITDDAGCSMTQSILITGPLPISASPAITDVTCAGDCDASIILTTTGGAGGYGYNWVPDPPNGDGTDTATDLCPGDWTVIITDANGCAASFTYTINGSTPLALTGSSTPSQCSLCNGTASVSVGGGAPGYSITWTDALGNNVGSGPGIIDLCAGLYTATVIDASGCSALLVVPVTDSNGEVLTMSDGFTTCANDCDGQVSVAFSCGVPSCTVLWTDALGNALGSANTLTGLCTGDYYVQVTNGDGCISIDTASVVPSQVLIPNVSSIPVSCAGACDGVATAGPTGGVLPYTFDWEPDPPGGDGNPQATGLCVGVYTVTIQDFTGCDTTVSVLITGPTPVSANAVVSDVSCSGDCNGSIVVTPTGGTPGYTFAWSPIPPNGDGSNGAFNLCEGDWTVTITDNNGCATTITYTIGGPPSIALSGSVIPSECGLCIGEASVQASGGVPPYTYSWINAGGTLVGTDSLITGLCSGFYTVTVIDANGCDAQLVVPVTDSNGEVLTTTNGTTTCTTSCDGTVSVDLICSDPPCVIAWFDALGVDLGENGNSVDSLCPGTYYVFVTNGSACVSIDTALVIPPAPILANLSTTPVTCPGDCNGTATVGPTGGTGSFYVYDWGPDPINGDGTPQVTDLCAGIYTVQITDSVGCDTIVSVLITEPLPISVSAAITDVSCAGDCTGSIVLTVTGGTAGYTFDWSPDPISGDGTSTVTDLCAGDYTIIIVDANGCDTTLTYTISEPLALQVGLLTTDNVCFGDCQGTASTTITGGVPAYAITWFDGGGAVIATDTTDISGVCAGNYLLHVVDANGCVTDVPFTITQGLAIDAGLVFTGETCLGPCDGVALINPSGGAGGFTITWIDPGGATYATDTTQVSDLCAGNWNVVIADSLGCDTTVAFTVLPYAPIVPDPTVQNVQCNGDCDGSIVINASGGIGTLDYAWTPVPPNGDGTNSATDLCPGPWSVTITDAVGCDTTLTFSITEPPDLTVAVDAAVDASCATASDGAISVTIGGGTGTLDVNWTGPGGFNSTSEDITDLAPGLYTVTVTDDNGCQEVVNVTVNALSTVVADAGVDFSQCVGGDIILDGSGSTGATGYVWTDGGGTTVGTTAIVTLTGLGPGVYTFTLTVSDGPCFDSDQVIVTVYALPIADAGPDQTIFLSEVAPLGGSPTGPSGSTFNWSPDTLVNISTIANPTTDVSQTTWFAVTVTDTITGCVNVDSVLITVVPDVVINSGFTPNGDGWNDSWVINFIDQFPGCEVEIYNRWGEMLFSSVGYNTPWDGRYNGGLVPAGTYYYVVKLNDPDFPEPYTGPLTVLR